MASEISGPVVGDVLNRIHYVHGVPNERLARLANVSASTMTRARDGAADLRATDLQSLSHALCRDGITDLAQAMLCPDFVVCRRGEGSGNGDLSDESAALFQGFASVLNAFERGDVDAGRAALAACRTTLDDAHVEFDGLASGSATGARAMSGTSR